MKAHWYHVVAGVGLLAAIVIGLMLIAAARDSSDRMEEMAYLDELRQGRAEVEGQGDDEMEIDGGVEAPRSCPEGMWPYSMTYVDLSFCYPKEWGLAEEEETQVSDAAREGTAYYVSFTEDVAPRLDFETYDFKLTGDRDTGPGIPAQGMSCFFGIGISSPEEEYPEEYPMEECFSGGPDTLISSSEVKTKNGYSALVAVVDVYQLSGPDKRTEFLFVSDVEQAGKLPINLRMWLNGDQSKDGLAVVESFE